MYTFYIISPKCAYDLKGHSIFHSNLTKVAPLKLISPFDTAGYDIMPDQWILP